jgi:DNA (cytosine-5)-methyltransferase 1
MKHRVNANLQAVDFFCSAGGVTHGFIKAGIEVLGGIDIDIKCKETYEKNNNVKFLHADVSKLKKRELASQFKIKKNQDNLIFVGCSPCQYYSNINTIKTKSTDTRLLLADFQEFVSYFRPGYVFVENVPGLDRKEDSPLGKFKKFLLDENYSFDEAIINAKHFGVPQNRRRYILIASRVTKNLSIPVADKENIKTVKSSIGDKNIFKPIEAGNYDKTDFIHTTSNLSDLNLARIETTPKNGGDHRAWSKTEGLRLNCYNDHDSHYDVYGRMSWDKPAPTITTRFDSLSNGRYGHPEQNRAISLREGASLQSFPIDYKFYATSKSVIAKMIGNAVPPELATRIARVLISAHKIK